MAAVTVRRTPRIQRALPERFSAAGAEELDRMIADAKAALGPSVRILGDRKSVV